MKRPLLWAVVWFALGEVLAICIGDVGQAGVLVCMPAFCVLWGCYGEKLGNLVAAWKKKSFNSGKKINVRVLWFAYLMLTLGFAVAKLYMWNMVAEKTVDEILAQSGEDSVSITGQGVVDEIVEKESDDESDAESEDTVYNIIIKLDSIRLKDADGAELEISDGCRVIIYGAEVVYKLGSSVSLSGDMYVFENADNPGSFDMKRYYQSRNVSFYMYDCNMELCSEKYNWLKQGLYDFKKGCSQRLKFITDADTADIYRGILLGDKYDIDSSIKMSFQLVGIGHILAISGVKMLSSVSLYTLKKPVNWAFVRLHIAEIYIIFTRILSRISPHCPSWGRGG